MITNQTTARERLAAAMAPAILAVGQAMSTDTGKMLFALAHDADVTLDWEQERYASQYQGKRPTKGSQETKYFEGMDIGKRNAFVSALAALASEMSGYEASAGRCRLVINSEIQAMKDRTDEQREAAPITALCSKALDL